MPIGDSHHADIVGAQVAGLTPILVDRRGADQKTDSYLKVKSLAELPALVDA